MSFLKRVSLYFSDYWATFFYFIFHHKYIPNFKTPITFSEKVNAIKIYNKNQLRANITDRLWVREYVAGITKEVKFAKNLWVGKCFEIDVWESLPKKFVIKANHGSGMVRLVDKDIDDFSSIKEMSEYWMNRFYSKYGREWYYYNLEKYLLVEELLPFSGDSLMDFKFFCFQGKVEFVEVDIDLFTKHRRNIYSKDFKLLDFQLLYPNGREVQKPLTFDRAIELAEKISTEFDFIRVDFYLFDSAIYLSELTNIPDGGSAKIIPKKYDYELGKKLPNLILR